jgi:iron complex outermembrane receptor protein
MRIALSAAVLAAAFVTSVPAQQAPSAARDTVRKDSVRTLPELTVIRSTAPLGTMPVATGVVDRNALRRGQATIGIDEALSNIPGVYIANRFNFSQDQRISIRGAGSRANFGTRGVKIILDGIPQTLPDGQSQLSNVEFGALDRAEVIRGAASSLYGNASGGVIALTSETAGPEAFSQRVRTIYGSFGLDKWQSFTSARGEKVSATLSLSRLTSTGFRQQSYTQQKLLNGALQIATSARGLLTFRVNWADAPFAGNAGALTRAEYLANRDSAAGNNILRGADKAVSQQQVAANYRWSDGAGFDLDATAFVLFRDLKNPLATPPPTGATATAGTYVAIDREVQGFRVQAAKLLGTTSRAPRLTLGVDAQRQNDQRTNQRSISGEPTLTFILAQRERVTEIGPFAQAQWSPVDRVSLLASGRFDRVRFDVEDYFLTDGNNSGVRNLDSWNGGFGVHVDVREEFQPYANVGTAFETPTTTELVNQPSGRGGFNDVLGPQRTTNVEVGARGRWRKYADYSVAVFRSTVDDAIVQFREIGGRAFFQNAGRTRNQGVEFGLSVQPIPQARVFGSYTFADYTFTDYVFTTAGTTTSFTGNRLSGVPRHYTRLGLRTTPWRTVVFDVDHTISTGLFADDANTNYVDGWNSTNARLSFSVRTRELEIAPFLGVNNVFDRDYVGAVTINGAFNRVLEPAALRNWYLGGEITFRTPLR